MIFINFKTYILFSSLIQGCVLQLSLPWHHCHCLHRSALGCHSHGTEWTPELNWVFNSQTIKNHPKKKYGSQLSEAHSTETSGKIKKEAASNQAEWVAAVPMKVPETRALNHQCFGRQRVVWRGCKWIQRSSGEKWFRGVRLRKWKSEVRKTSTNWSCLYVPFNVCTKVTHEDSMSRQV